MSAQVGDRITVPAHRVGEHPREGEILEVLTGPGDDHYRVRWADGHESIVSAAGDATVEPVREQSAGSV